MDHNIISKAILELAPGAEFAYRDDNLDLMEWHTPEIEQPSKEAIEKKVKELEIQLKKNKEQKEKARESALAKLAALGLTEDEIAAL